MRMIRERGLRAGQFLVAGTTHEAMQALYEDGFFHLGAHIARLGALRLQRNLYMDPLSSVSLDDEMEELQLGMVANKVILDKARAGFWNFIKTDFLEGNMGLYRSGRFTMAAGYYGLPADFTFGGVPIFRKSVLIPEEWQFKKFENLLLGQLLLVPDTTEPWEHPDVDGLRRQLESV